MTQNGGQPVDPWAVHEHDSHGDVRHVHAPEATYSFGVEHRIEIMPHFPEVDVIDLMYFRGLVVTISLEVQIQKEQTNLENMEVYAQNFSIVTAYTDASLYQGLLQATDHMLSERGIDPPTSLTEIASSNIAGAGYTVVEESGQLYVHFKGGGLYKYSGVGPDIAAGLWQAESPGGFFHARIRDRYTTEQIKGAG